MRRRIIGTGFSILCGTLDITNYNSTTVEITDITKHFRAKPTVIFDISDNGYWFGWNASTGHVKVWQNASSGACTECDDEEDAGKANFIAVGVEQ